jgi:hypothetical protein
MHGRKRDPYMRLARSLNNSHAMTLVEVYPLINFIIEKLNKKKGCTSK